MGVKENRERVTGQEEYFTNDDVVLKCVDQYVSLINKDDVLIDPAAGDGAFARGLRTRGVKNSLIEWDTNPKAEDVEKLDLLKMDLSKYGESLCAITNPPFGRANSLCVKFFNHLAPHSKLIGFIVPISWRKWSIQNRLDRNFVLESDIAMPMHCFHKPDGTPINTGILKTVFQVWRRSTRKRALHTAEHRGYFVKTTPKKADVAFIAFGYKTGEVKTEFERKPNTCTLFLKVKNNSVIDAMREIDVTEFTKRCAYTECISMVELRALLNRYFDNLTDRKGA